MQAADLDRSPAGSDVPRGSEEPWYVRSFGRDYLELYRHRDREEARQAVALAVEELALVPSAAVLDLGCGAGRHLEALRDRGFAPVGLDLSRVLLCEAKRRGAAPGLVRGDMRWLPFVDGVFDAVLSFFTSFGYFADDSENQAVLREVRRVLRPGGGFLLDFLNRDHVLRHGPRDTREVRGGCVIHQARRVDPERDAILKTITITPRSGRPGEVRSYRESVRLYSPAALTSLADEAGLAAVARRGTWTGDPFRTSSPRFILFCRKQPL
ncbi:MAG: class I SAM-dependent methyltransferase [Planctomycetes bacterium]|nr:class I SAM-dependent methyltransferase [Planctomycetota bacterium]